VGWVDYTGSGVETIAHLRENGRVCVMFASCGYGVPVMDLVGERDLLRLGAEKRRPDGMDAYRAEKNARSIDGLPGL
jgi:hypothetical protein